MKADHFTTPSGREISVRDMRPEDADLLVDLFYHLSPETIYKRFHAVLANLPEERVRRLAADMADNDPEDEVALLALHEGTAVGVARFHRLPETTDAESAIVVRDDYQRDGLGTFLLALLRERALEMGITHLIAIVHAHNNPILKVVGRSGLKADWRFEQGESYLSVDLASGEPEPPGADGAD
jgi:RimJ/RimL family protein N-acetyltransferase